MEWLSDPQAWIALITLTVLEVVLGIDNIVFISIETGHLPEEQRKKARRTGLLLALVMRIALLSMLSWIMKLTEPLFSVLDNEISGRDLILLVGGLFLLGKSTVEIHHNMDPERHRKLAAGSGTKTMGAVLAQIAILDLIFSLDSVITAVGMVDELGVMVTAVIVSVVVMVLFVNTICDFVEKHPTFKILALSFLLLIGVALVGEGLEFHIPKGYIYFAMAFSVAVELVNMRVRGAKEKAGKPS